MAAFLAYVSRIFFVSLFNDCPQAGQSTTLISAVERIVVTAWHFSQVKVSWFMDDKLLSILYGLLVASAVSPLQFFDQRPRMDHHFHNSLVLY